MRADKHFTYSVALDGFYHDSVIWYTVPPSSLPLLIVNAHVATVGSPAGAMSLRLGGTLYTHPLTLTAFGNASDRYLIAYARHGALTSPND